MFSSFCSFYNNTVKEYICVYLYSNTGTISKSNIVLNNSPSLGVIYTYLGNYNLIECIFDQNNNILLFGNSGSLQLNNCYYLKGSSSSYGSITNSLISSNINLYSYFFYECNLYIYSPIQTICYFNDTMKKRIIQYLGFYFITYF